MIKNTLLNRITRDITDGLVALNMHDNVSFILLSVFGLIYRKQKTIWGLCIPHFVLGTAIVVLFELYRNLYRNL